MSFLVLKVRFETARHVFSSQQEAKPYNARYARSVINTWRWG